MLKRYGWLLPTIVLLAAAVYVGWYVTHHHLAVLGPGGQIAQQERSLLILASILSVIVVIPTFAIAIFIAVRYRDRGDQPGKRRQPHYHPEFDHSRLFESIWWGIPIVIIGILSVVTWRSAHQLDPYKPLASHQKTLTIQVVSLDWKWLFIYPDQHIASVNLAMIPTDRPVNFMITSDTVMNSFWVPGLGGQIYSMPGMITQLHEQANKPGDYLGSPANIAGHGFSRMDFTVRAGSPAAFSAWVKQAQQAKRNLATASYAELTKPSSDVPVQYYSPVEDGLFDTIVMNYMMPMPTTPTPTAPTSTPPVMHEHGTMSMPSMEMNQ